MAASMSRTMATAPSTACAPLADPEMIRPCPSPVSFGDYILHGGDRGETTLEGPAGRRSPSPGHGRGGPCRYHTAAAHRRHARAGGLPARARRRHRAAGLGSLLLPRVAPPL